MRPLSRSGLALLTGASLLLSGCATLVNSDHQSIRIFSEPSEATVTVDGLFHLATAGTVSLSRFSDHTVVIEKDGYEPVILKVERRMSKWVWANGWCLLFVVKCVQQDRDAGGFWTFDDDIHVALTRRADGGPPQPAQ
jgi:hypothetical protein